MRWILVPTTVAAALLFSSAGSAQQNPTARFTVMLTGEEEVTPGDPDGTGTAVIRINTRSNQLCYQIRVRNIEPASAAHIHEAPAGSAGPVVITLNPPTRGWSSGCQRVAREQLLEIIASPEDYYVNVHNDPYPAGALRGQLG